MIGDALGIAAFYQTDKYVGEHDGALLHYLVVADDVDHCRGSDNGDAVEHVFGEFDIGYLDDAFLAEAPAGQIVAYGDGGVELLDAENTHGTEKCPGGYMVDDGAVLQSSDSQFFLVCCHFSRGLIPRARVNMA